MTTIAEKLTAINDAKEAIKVAIADKGVDMAGVALPQYAEKIAEIPTGGGGGGGESAPQYTGHADVEGLKAIGWTDEDIAYYQQYGVNWDEEDDEFHKVPEENIAIYKEINADNYKDYISKIVYMPKIDFSKKTTMDGGFRGFTSLTAIPALDFTRVTNITQLCMYNRNLVCVGPLHTPAVTLATSVFTDCSALRRYVPMNLSKVESIEGIYSGCYSIEEVVFDNLSNSVSLKNCCKNCYNLKSVVLPVMDNVTVAESAFDFCVSLESIKISLGAKLKKINSLCYWNYRLTRMGEVNITNVTDLSASVWQYCYSLVDIRLKGAKGAIGWSAAKWLNGESLIYAINNASSTCTITLHALAYARLSNDAEVVTALANKTYVTLASA